MADGEVVLGIDPGGVTGWVLGQVAGRDFKVVSWGEEPNQILMCTRVHRLAHRREPGHQREVGTVVMERWVSIGGVRSFEPAALEIIGTVRYLCATYDIPLVMQGAADAKAFGHPERIAPYRLISGGRVGYRGAGHALMALRHVLLWVGTRSLAVDTEEGARA